MDACGTRRAPLGRTVGLTGAFRILLKTSGPIEENLELLAVAETWTRKAVSETLKRL